MQFMATSGGPHPPRQWAMITAGQIIQIADTAAGAQIDAARQMQARLVDALDHFYAHVQNDERVQLAQHGDRWLDEPLDPTPFLDDGINVVIDNIDKQFREHFDQEHVREYLRNLLGQHCATMMDIERKWHIHRQQQ